MILYLALAIAPEERGFPVVVKREVGGCTYQIQDMIMHEDKDLASWFAGMQPKSDQIDILWVRQRDRECILRLRRHIETAGFTRIVVKRDDASEYYMGPPPPASQP